MKKIADIIIAIIVGIAVFTFASYTNSFGRFFISNAACIIGFFFIRPNY